MMDLNKDDGTTADMLAKLENMCGEPSLLPGEDLQAYRALRKQIVEAVQPTNAIELLLLQDCVDGAWEDWRLRRGKGAMILAAVPAAIRELVRPAYGEKMAGDVSSAYASGSEEERKEVMEDLGAAGLGQAEVRAKAMELRLQVLMSIDRLHACAAQRRTLALREIDRQKQSRQATEESVEAARPARAARS